MPVLDIPLVTQDQSPTSQIAPNGLLKLVMNGRYVDYGQTTSIRKRVGYHVHTITGLPDEPVDAISEHDGVRIAYVDGDVYTYDSVRNAWTAQGDSGSVSVTERRSILSSSTTVPNAVDSAQAGTRTVYLSHTPPNQVFYYELRDTATGNTIIPPTIVSAGALYNGFVRCAASSTHIFIAYEDRTNNDLRALVIDVSDDSVSSDTAIITDLNGGVSSCFDIIHDDNGDFDIAYHRSGGAITVKRFTSAKSNTLTSGGAVPLGTPTGIGLGLTTNGDGLLVYRNSTGSVYQPWHINQTNLSITAFADFGNASANPVVRVGISKTDDADELMVIWTHRPGSGTDSTHMRVLDPGANTVLATVRNLYDLTLGSKPIYDEDRGKVYAVVGHQGFEDQTQRDAYMVNLRADEVRTGSASIVPYVEARFAHGIYHDDSSKELTGFITEPSDGVYEYFHGTFTSAQTEQLPGLIDLKATRFTSVQNGRHVSVDVGTLQYVAGGGLKVWDGFELTEAGFEYFNWATNGDITSSTGGGSVVAGDYEFQITFEWKSQDGSVWRSAASPIDTVTIGGAPPNQFDFTLPQLRLTRRLDTTNPVTIALYRSLVDATGAHHRMVALGTAPPVNDPHTAGKLAHSDGNADAAFADRDLLYQDGNVAFNEAPPPSNIIWTHDDALCGVDPEDPTRVWVTKRTEYGIPAEHNGFFQIRVDSSTGITAGASSDGLIILFDETSVYVVGGQGFTNTLQGGYQPPRKLPASNGCVNHLSVVQGGTNGDIYFQSNAGICVMSRGGQQVQIISAPIQTTLEAFPVVRGSVLDPARSLIYWSVTDSLGLNGCLVIYDYRRGKWIVDVISGLVPGRLAMWDGEVAIAMIDNKLIYRSAGDAASDVYLDFDGGEGGGYDFTIATHEVRFGGLNGMAHVHKVGVVGEMLETANDSPSFDITIGANGQGGIPVTLGEGSGAPGDGGAATVYTQTFEVNSGADRALGQADDGATVRREFSPAVSRFSSLEIWLSTASTDNTPDMAFSGLSIEYTELRGLGWTVGASSKERG